MHHYKYNRHKVHECTDFYFEQVYGTTQKSENLKIAEHFDSFQVWLVVTDLLFYTTIRVSNNLVLLALQDYNLQSRYLDCNGFPVMPF